MYNEPSQFELLVQENNVTRLEIQSPRLCTLLINLTLQLSECDLKVCSRVVH